MLYLLETMKTQFVYAGIISITILEALAIIQGIDGYALAIAVGAIASIATGTTVKFRTRNHNNITPRDDDSPAKK